MELSNLFNIYLMAVQSGEITEDGPTGGCPVDPSTGEPYS